MELKAFLFDEDRGVSPVIGVILMVAITVILAAVIATFVMNMGPPEDQAPSASWSFDQTEWGSGENLTVSHDGGDQVDGEELYLSVSNASAGNGNHQWVSDLGGPAEVSATDSVTLANATIDSINGSTSLDLSGATVELVWESSDADKSQTLKEWSN